MAYKVRLDPGLDGSGLSFELVCLDGFEDSEWPTYEQVIDSSNQICLAYHFGLEYDSVRPLKNQYGEAARAYDFLRSKVGTVIDDPGIFTGSAGRFERCDACGALHRKGYGGDCRNDAERYFDDDQNGFGPPVSSTVLKARERGPERL